MGNPVTRARRAAILALLASLLLANPLYVGLFFEEPRHRSPTGYSTKVIDPTIGPDAKVVIRELGDDEVLYVETLLDRSDYNREGSQYEAPMETAVLLQEAQVNTSVTTDREDVSFTLHRLDANFQFAAFDSADGTQFSRFEVEERNGSTVVTTHTASRSAVAEYIVYDDARLYSALPGDEQRVVDKVISAEDYGYRPYEDEDFGHLIDDLVVKNGTYYVFVDAIHVDDFGFDVRTVASFLLYASGLVLFLIAAVLTALTD